MAQKYYRTNIQTKKYLNIKILQRLFNNQNLSYLNRKNNYDISI
jgi:hypothetical protein